METDFDVVEEDSNLGKANISTLFIFDYINILNAIVF